MEDVDIKVSAVRPEDCPISEQEEKVLVARILKAMQIVDRADREYGSHPRRRRWFSAWNPFALRARMEMWRTVFTSLERRDHD